MKIKFNKSLSDYNYVLMFDLASKISGVCLWNISEHRPTHTRVIKVDLNTELPVVELYNKLNDLFQWLDDLGIARNEVLIYQEAMPVQLRGGSSTVQTFVSLARSHAILDLYTSQNGLAIYDYVGVYPASTHSYLRKLNGWDSTHKVDKNDIKNYVETTYDLKDLTFDEADAVFLAQTFVDVKWNKDLTEEIKAVKRHSKELKSQRGIDACTLEQKRLEGLKTASE